MERTESLNSPPYVPQVEHDTYELNKILARAGEVREQAASIAWRTSRLVDAFTGLDDKSNEPEECREIDMPSSIYPCLHKEIDRIETYLAEIVDSLTHL